MTGSAERAERLMARALVVARRHHPSPNPRVGAVVARGDEILSVGAHRRVGDAHAEIVALAGAGARARGAELYVTLEPCNHFGLTPPCAEAIVAAGVRTVYFGCADPNPHVQGGGVALLRRAGIEVIEGVRRAEAEALVEDFAKAMTKELPFVTLKLAQTLDGRIATRTGDTRWVTGPEARKRAHRLRRDHDAVMVGIGTVLADDPALTVRLVRGPSPRRVIVDSRLRTPPRAAALKGGALVLCAEAGPRRRAALERAGAEVIVCPGKGGRVDLRKGMKALVRRGVLAVLAEGGGELAGSLLEAGLVDRAVMFVSPRIVGGRQAVAAIAGNGVARLADAWNLEESRVLRVGGDWMFSGRIRGRS
jgi:diaminohydroxyphosphoribosylaminopyrimidine deaminase / 5-amino-6-(5-phosphoribosylamino)uracil reductase